MIGGSHKLARRVLLAACGVFSLAAIAGNPVYATDTRVTSVSAFDVHGREVATRLADGTSILRKFDAWGRVTSEEARDASGSTITGEISFDRTPAGRLRSLTSMVDAGVTRQTTLAWDGGGRTTGVASNGRASRTAFDPAGRMTSTAVGEGSATSLEATAVSQEVTSHNGALPQTLKTTEKTSTAIDVELRFDTAANVVTERIGTSLEWNQTFDQAGNVTTAALPQRPASSFAYDARSALTLETMPDGAQNAYTYAESGALSSYLDPSNEAAVQVDADLIGRPLKRTYADGSIELFSYDGERLASFTDRQNRIQVFAYNARGQLTGIDQQAGAPLERFAYDDAGRLVSWKNADSELRWSDFNYEGAPKKTVQRRFRDGSGFSSRVVIDEFEQSHHWNEHGERTQFSMPAYSGMMPGAGWATTIEQRYDALGNLTEVRRGAPLMIASYRNAGHPDTRTITTAAGATIDRRYGYDDATSLLERLVVYANGLLIAGSELTFDGLQIRSAQLLGVASEKQFTHWSYDARGRLRASIAGASAAADVTAPIPGRANEELTPADFRLEQERMSRFDAFATAALTAKSVDTSSVDPPTATFEEKAGGGHKISKVTKGAKSYSFAWNGAERVDDGRFTYEFDAKGRLIRATEKTIGAPIRRLLYSYGGTGRLLGRRAEYAVNASPSEDDWRLEDRATILAADGLPAETTYVWDPISDNLIALFKSGATPADPHGGLIKQIIHGGAAYDDPIEVATIDAATGNVTHLYPIYDEAGAGSLQAVVNEQGQVVARTLANDAYGAEDIDFAGAAIDSASVRLTKDAAGTIAQIEITLHATERLDPSTVATGTRLAAVDATGAVVRTSAATATPAPDDPFTIRWTLTPAQWTALTDPTPETIDGISRAPIALSIAVTNTLRALAWGSNVPVMPPPEWAIATQPVHTTPGLPVEIRESFSSLATLAAIVPAGQTQTSAIYTIETLALAGNTGGATSFIEDAVSARFHALPFAEPATGLIYARARWYDPNTGTFLSPDPKGYVDSSNLYAFAGGDPVNRRDPTGLDDCLGFGNKSCADYAKDLPDQIADAVGLHDLPSTGSEKIDKRIRQVAQAPLRVAAAPTTMLLSTGESLGEVGYRMERSTFHGEQAFEASIDDALLVAGAMGDIATVAAPLGMLKGAPELIGSRASQRGSITIMGRKRDPRGRFVADPNNPPSPYVFTDTQRREAWKKLALDPGSPLSAAERAEIKARGWRGPQRYNEFGELETMELSHEPVPLREAGTDVVPRWPSEHAEVDPFRHLKKR